MYINSLDFSNNFMTLALLLCPFLMRKWIYALPAQQITSIFREKIIKLENTSFVAQALISLPNAQYFSE